MPFGKKKKQKRKPAPKPKSQTRPKPYTAPEIPKGYKKPFSGKSAEIIDQPTAKTLQVDPEKEFVRVFKELTRMRTHWSVWKDFVLMSACALSNAVDKSHYDEREERYLNAIRKYTKAEQQLFPELFAHTVMALELNPEQDFLGRMATLLDVTEKSKQQIFTPYSVSELMAEITMDDVAEQVRKKGYVTIDDCCCGAGSTLIAGVNTAKKRLEKEELNFQNHVLISGQDVDETMALACYIQLSLLGVAGVIKVGNTLTDPMSSVDTLENYWFTPMYFSDVWAFRRAIRQLDALF